MVPVLISMSYLLMLGPWDIYIEDVLLVLILHARTNISFWDSSKSLRSINCVRVLGMSGELAGP